MMSPGVMGGNSRLCATISPEKQQGPAISQTTLQKIGQTQDFSAGVTAQQSWPVYEFSGLFLNAEKGGARKVPIVAGCRPHSDFYVAPSLFVEVHKNVFLTYLSFSFLLSSPVGSSTFTRRGHFSGLYITALSKNNAPTNTTATFTQRGCGWCANVCYCRHNCSQLDFTPAKWPT